MRFEKKEGKKTQFWDIGRNDNVLQEREGSGKDNPALRYRLFADADAARAELARRLRKRYAQGFVPADEEGRQLVAELKPQGPAPKAAPALPLRQDVHLYNEANGFLFTSQKMAGAGLEEGTKSWEKAVVAGRILPVSLIQDDSFNVRVVAGGELSEQEADDWVGRIEWRLHVPDGKLVICAGAEFVMGEYDDEDSYYDDYVRTVAVPAGHYRATVYAYLPGINGAATLDQLAGGYQRMERAGTWFRRTRPGEPFPAWLHEWCVGDPRNDPGHEAEWKAQRSLPDEAIPDTIDFLLHLEPVEAPAKGAKLDKPPAEVFEGGWFGETAGARRPERCPQGLAAHDLIGTLSPASEGAGQGEWMYLWQLPAKVPGFKLKPIKGGPVQLPAAALADVFRLAVSAHANTGCEVVIAPEGAAIELGGEWPVGVMALRDGDSVRIGISNDCRPRDAVKLLQALAPRWSALPDGIELRLDCSQMDDSAFAGGAVPPGLQRYRGRVRGGTWQIEATFPQVEAGTLRDALALSAEVAAGDAITVRSKDEGAAILKWAKGNYGDFIDDNPASINGGKLRLKKREPGLLGIYGSCAFAVRFGDTWPVMDLSDDEDEASDEAGGWQTPEPIKGAKLLEVPGGRTYYNSMAMMLSEKIADTLRKDDRALAKLGFRHVGDIVCSQFTNIVIRGYAMAGADGRTDTWAVILCAAPNVMKFEFSTRFDDGVASLLTSAQAGAQEDVAKRAFRQYLEGASYEELLARHLARKEELTATCGAAVAYDAKLAGLAAAIEVALKHQSGD